MYFKSIEMTGFKSFVDSTKITFGAGVTAIVGPNGCGKSNISDGVRWVLGEQRPKLLRGAKMEDFIFSGSVARKQSGMAEVSITIADIKGKLSRPELAEYDEVTVTRRLYRSGESEYLINSTPCRLKDLIDLFLDTGISTRAFSIIEQDQVQKIVTSKPEDRRFIIEEAAGIMKYKNRRHQALNKLESSKGNLDRVSDIISELERQRNSLKRQANKAERFKTFKVEMEDLFLATSADELRSLNTLDSSVKKEIDRLEEVRASLETDISTRKNELISLQSSIDELSQNHSELKEEEYRLTSTIESNERQITLFTDQISESSIVAEKLENEIVELEGRTGEMERGLEGKDEVIQNRELEVTEKRSKLEERKKEQVLESSKIGEIETAISQKQVEIGRIRGLAADKGNELASDRTRIEILGQRIKKTFFEKEEAEIAIAEIKGRKEKKEEGIRETQATFDRLQEDIDALGSKRSELLNAKNETENQISDIKTILTENSTRLESLLEVESSFEGYQDGVRSLLKLKEENHPISGKLRGTLVDSISTDKRYEGGLEAVLGHKLESLIVERPEDAIEAINLLHSSKLGRATFLSIESGAAGESLQSVSGKGVIGMAVDLIKTDDRLRPLIKNLLSNVVFIESLEEAIPLGSQNGYTFVTLKGDILDNSGVITGGTSGNAGGGMLERKRIIEELSKAVEENRKTVETEKAKLEAVLAELGVVESGKEEKEKLVKREELVLVHARKDSETLDSEKERHETRLETFKAEMDSFEMEKDNLNGEISLLEKEITELNQQQASLTEELESLETDEKESRTKVAGFADGVSAMEVSLTSLNGELEMARLEKDQMVNSIAELKNRVTVMRNDIEAGSNKKRELEEQIERLKDAIHDGLERKHELSGKLEETSERLEMDREAIEKKTTDVDDSENSLNMTKDSLTEAKQKYTETSMRISALLEKIEEQNHTPEEVKNFDTSGMDMEECRNRMAELKEKMTQFGDVNMSAIDDYNQVMERLTFLTTQRDDLLESIDNIRKVIDKLDRTTKQLFIDAFEAISKNFSANFKRLFNGGEAEMILTDESNILESGIEIMARPPGKKRQSLTLLSAGERAMTALSVLFSVFMEMPSPFCLLDEVDAPLDEANIGRFKDIITDFSETTQFLVITHNQKTMAFADRLYGITMQQPGVSQVLSVDMVQTDTVAPEELTATASG